jgi:hypothetical protein
MKSRLVVAIVCIVLGIGLGAFSFGVRNNEVRCYTTPGLLLLLFGGLLIRQFYRSQQATRSANWYEVTKKYHVLTFAHDGDLGCLPETWQRELAAPWRLEADVNNGTYLQFLQNWGVESYVYASQALKKIGAHQMAEIVDCCQALVDEHFDCEGRSVVERRRLMPNAILDLQGKTVKKAGSVLPDEVVERIYVLSYEFMRYPDDIATLGMRYYAAFIELDDTPR